MSSHRPFSTGLEDGRGQLLWEDGERALFRGPKTDSKIPVPGVLALRLTAENPTQASIDRLVHEHGLKEHLERAWAARPLELVRDRDWTMLLLEDPGGTPLDQLLGEPMEIHRFLRLAIGITAALGQAHQRGLVHRDMKPAHILVDGINGHARLTGFGLASLLPRERQSPDRPGFIAGTLAYMAPEQTGRMNRSIDSRSDLYALGVIFYEMLTCVRPFAASDPMGWVHCHIARIPLPPCQRVTNIPYAISQIVMKLLAKTPEERYQTASGVERDLQRCLAELQANGRIDPFLLGKLDIPEHLLIPGKLFGREREIAVLLGAYDNVATTGAPALVLIDGHSGTGKSSIVNELHKALVASGGLFAVGKFDPQTRDIPYRAITQALQGLIYGLMSASEVELQTWRGTLSEALGAHGQLLVALVPELELIIGAQAAIPDLPPQQTRRLFQNALRRFTGAFASPEHPLTLFLDDLHWADAATLDFLRDLLIQSGLRHLLVIGAYRNNEVDLTHPLMRTIESIRTAGAHIGQITLQPLAREHLDEFVADALRCTSLRAAPLAQLVHEKTGGNPFFAIKFLLALVDKDLVAFDASAGEWSWDLDRVRAQEHTENVTELMVGKLNQLSAATQTALQHLACLGNDADTSLLATTLEISEERVHATLWGAAQQDLVERLDGSYRFVHDRIQEAAYSSIPAGQRAAAHLRNGRLLLARTPPEKREGAIFEIVNQLNLGHGSITSVEERRKLAEYNLTAGRRAQASTAFASALNYFITGGELLAQDCREQRPELSFALDLHRAECEMLTGALADADNHLAALTARAADSAERANVARLRIDLYSWMHQINRSVAVGREYLQFLGIHWSPQPTDAEAERAYRRIQAELARRTTEELICLPLMTDVAALATLDVMNRLASPAQYSDLNLYTLIACEMLHLTLDRGASDASAAAFVRLGMVAGLRFGEYEVARRVGRVAHGLIEQRGLQRFRAAVYLNYGNLVMPWTSHFRECCVLIDQAFDAAQKSGDVRYAGISSAVRILTLATVAETLSDIEREAGNALAFSQQAQLIPGVEVATVVLALARMLRGATPTFGSLDDGSFHEQRTECDFADNPDNPGIQCWYWTCKLLARFLAGDYATALHAAARAQPLLNMSLTITQTADFHLYTALAHAAYCDSLPTDQRTVNLTALASHYRQLASWAATCPQNFEDRAALVGAELARLERRELEAEQLYAQSIRSARTHGFIRNEALANELASRFYSGRGLEDIAAMYLEKARNGYLRWGAEGKVRQLEASHPQLRSPSPTAPTGLIGVPVEHLDLATVIKVSQTVSSEIVLETLIDTLLRTALEQAGAQRGVLIVTRGGELWCVAEANTQQDSIAVELRDTPLAEALLPQSVILYVQRMREAIVLDDAVAQQPFAADPYICHRRARSVLCLPLLAQAKLSGVLYLENNLAPRVFEHSRAAVLKLLASQAAISLENASLYRDVAEREARFRRLVDANIIGTFIWRAAGPNIDSDDLAVIEANDAFLNMLGYEREDIAAARMTRLTLTPPEWQERDTQHLAGVKATGSVLPFEKEYFRKDGTRVPVLVGVAAFQHQPGHGVAFVIDLTERKRAELALRRASDKLAEAAQAESLAMLSASIAHEVNQPLAAIVANSNACHRWLSAAPPNLERAKMTAERITRDANSAADIVSRIRALFRRAPLVRSSQEVNGLIIEVCRMMAVEIAARNVRVTTDLEPGLPAVSVDRVQVQQVFVNLIRNGIEAMDTVVAGDRSLQIQSFRDGHDAIRVEVRDAGTGFKNAERAFEPFYTTKQHGMGMGLAICRSIIESHGGRLWTTNHEPRGATVAVTLRLGANE